MTDNAAAPRKALKKTDDAKVATRAVKKEDTLTPEQQAAKDKLAEIFTNAEKLVEDAQTKVDEVTEAMNTESDEEKKTLLVQDLKAANDQLALANITLENAKKGVEQQDTTSKATRAKEDKVQVQVTKAFKLTLDDGTVQQFTPGVQKVDAHIARHWYSQANGMQVLDK